MRSKGFVYFIVVIEAIAMGASFVAMKYALEAVDPMAVNAARWGLGGVTAVVLAVAGVLRIDFSGKPKKYIFLVGLTLPCVYATFETTATDLIPAAQASIQISLIPIFVMIISTIVFKLRADMKVWLFFIMATIGVMLTVDISSGLGGSFKGSLLMMGAVLMGSLYNIISPITQEKGFTNMEITFVMCIMGGLWFNSYIAARGDFFDIYAEIATTPSALVAILFLGIVCSVLCYLAINYSLKYLEPHKVTLVGVNVCTVSGVVLGIIVRGDNLSVLTWIGFGLIFIGVMGALWPKKEV